MTKPGLVLIDIQRDYFPGGRFTLPHIESAAAQASSLLAYFRQQSLPIFHVQHFELDENAPFFVSETDGVEIHESVSPGDDEPIIKKNFPNSFRDTQLATLLKTADVTQTIFCGAMSNMCVDATVRAAFDLGFDCTVVHDACAASELDFAGKTLSADDVHGAFMAALGSAYGNIVSLQEFVSS